MRFYNDSPSLTFDDVLLRPGFSKILPSDVDLKTKFSRNITMNMPIISAAMDTVTEAKTAIVMAQEGGIGVVHYNMTIEEQALQVSKVKKYEAGMILDPITIGPEEPISKVGEITQTYKISGVPVIDPNGTLIGILTNRDLRFETNFNQKVKEVMTSGNLITAPEGTGLEEAKQILQKHRIEKLPVVNNEMKLIGLITIKDIKKSIAYPNSNKDSLGRLRVAAAVGVGESGYERTKALVAAGVDAVVIDTAHGHSAKVIETIQVIKKEFPDIDVVAGNVATSAGCEALIKAGVDAVKVGIGPGSICTTRVISGIGVPQMSAILECHEVCRVAQVPMISDGGIKYSGDIVKALAGGASSIMIGSLFAGTDEAPGEMIIYQGRSYKMYRGMGSIGAMILGSKTRYGQSQVADQQKLVPEGVEGQVPYRGSLSSNVYQLLGGIRSGLGYVGAENLVELYDKAEFITLSSSSHKEGHPHDVHITKEAPNYRL